MKYLLIMFLCSIFTIHAQIHWESASNFPVYSPEDFVLDKNGNLYLSIRGNDLIFKTNIFDPTLQYDKLPKVSSKFFRYDQNPISLFLDFNDTLIAQRGAVPYRYFGTHFAKDSVGRIDTNYSSMSTSFFMKYNLEGDLFGSFLNAIFQYKDKWKNDRNNTVFDGSTVFNYFPFDEENNYALVGGNSYRVIKYNSRTLERTPVFETNTPMDYRNLTVTADGHIFAGTSVGLYHSYNEGKDFEVVLIDSALGNTITDHVYQSKSGDAIVAHIASGFYVSYNKGKNWVKLHQFSQNLPKDRSALWEKIEIIDTSHAALMIRTGCYTYETYILSATQQEWRKMEPPAFKMNAFHLTKNKKNRLYAQNDLCNWMYSDDEGVEWQEVLRDGVPVQNLGKDRRDQLYCFHPFGVDSKVLYWSKDDGHSWDTNEVFQGRVLGFHSFSDGTQMLLTAPPNSGAFIPYYVYYNTDHGQSWSLQNNRFGPSSEIRQILKSPDGNLFAFLLNSRDVMVSTDLGKIWKRDERFSNIRNIGSMFFDEVGYFVFIGYLNEVYGMYRSLDLISFEKITLNGSGVPESIYNVTAGVIVGSFPKSGMHITYDYGQNWTNITTDLDFDIANRSYSTNSILVDENGRIFLARAYDGIYRTNAMAVAVEEPLGEKNTFLSFGPNPTEAFLNVRFTETIAGLNTELELSNSLGQCILKRKNISQTEMIDLRNFAPGIYYLSVKTAAGLMHTEKIIKR